VTDRATFGDFAAAAQEQLSRAVWQPDPGISHPGAPACGAEEFTHSLHSLVTVMTRYSADVETAIARLSPDSRRQMGPWLRASSRTREALDNAAAFLQPGPSDTRPRPTPTTPAGRSLAAAAAALRTGRDLLHTHTAARPGGTPADRSEWAPVIASPPVTDAAGNARRAWLYAARGWDLITTDTRGTLSPAAAETADLALWTGRLAYADPAWTPDLGPSRTARPAAQLTDTPAVIAAVHHACETLTQVAAADHAQLTAAARTGRLLVPTRSLPEEFDIPHRFAPAPAARTQPLLTAYHDARTASAQATASTAVVAETVRSPSRILTTARTAVASNTSTTSLRPDAPLAPAASRPGPALPGPVERILRDLGETSIAMLQQATAIDQAAEQLILHTAHQPDHPARPATRDPSRSAATAEVINHILTSAHPATAAILCAPEPAHPRNLKK